MKAICCAILSFVANHNAYKIYTITAKDDYIKYFLLSVSWVLFIISIILMILGK